jgi:hypothetical protein
MPSNYTENLVRISPPWLQRSVGGRLLRSIGALADEISSRIVQGVALRFPTDVVDPDALALTGQERRMLRGPAEDAVTYARRIRSWWDAHRIRGGPYALLEQFHAYLSGLLNVQIDCVYWSGTRRSISIDGVITRDSISWGADGSSEWSQIWLFLYLAADIVTTSDETLIDDDGNTLMFTIGDPDDLEVLRAIPREWSAAHIHRTTIVVLADYRQLWDYPPAILTWDDDEGLWDDTPTITSFEA